MADLNKLASDLNARKPSPASTANCMRRVAKELQVIYLEHFRMLEGRGNKHGFPAKHFWNREVARHTTTASGADSASLRVASAAYVHKISGGRIMPKNAKSLAIPLSPRAYAAGAPRICGLPLIFIPDLTHKVIGYLVEHEVYGVKSRAKRDGTHNVANKKTVGTMHYVLVPFVDQAAMPDAKPPENTKRQRISAVIRSWLANR